MNATIIKRLALLSILCFPAPIFAAGLVSHISASISSGISVTAGPINTTTANLIVIAVAYGHNTGTISVSDSLNNVTCWTPMNQYGAGTTPTNVQMFYCLNPIVGSAQTFTATASGSTLWQSIAVGAFNGISSSPLDAQNGMAASGAGNFKTGSITPSQNGDIIISAISDFSSSTDSIDSGMTVIEQKQAVGGTSFGVSLAWGTQLIAGPINPSWSIGPQGTNQFSAATVAAFKASSSNVSSLSPGTLTGNVTLAGGSDIGVSQVGQTIAIGLSPIGTGVLNLGTASIAAGSCAADVTATVNGVLNFIALPNSNPTLSNGYGPGGPLNIWEFVTTNTIHILVCNNDTTTAHAPGPLSVFYVAF